MIEQYATLSRQAICQLPKAELHLHIEGTLEPQLALALAERNHITLPYASLEELRKQYEFTNLQSFLDLYYQLMSTLKTAKDFRDLMVAYLEHAHNDGVRHAEIFFDPQVHVRNGLDYDMVLDGLLAGMQYGRARFGITSSLILCIVRDMPVEDAHRILDLAAPRAHELCGIGLDSAEVGYPPKLFDEVFARARAMGLHVVAHAGEEGPSSYVEQALNILHVERIDHGVRAIDDAQVVQQCARDRIGMTSCPLSNRRLQVVDDISKLPLRALLEAGVPVSLHSDDPAYFGGYIADNYQALADIGFSAAELAQFAQHSIETSFIDKSERQLLLEELTQWRAQYVA